MKQMLTRLDDDLADALRQRAKRSGESVNAYVNRILRIVLSGSGTGDAPRSQRQLWKAVAIADGRLVDRPSQLRGAVALSRDATSLVTTPPGYASRLTSDERDER